MLSGCQMNHHNKCEEFPSKQHPSKDHQSDAYNRYVLPCSSPSSSNMPSLSTASSYSSDFTSSPRITPYRNCSHDALSGESALLLYQAFVDRESSHEGNLNEQSHDGGTSQHMIRPDDTDRISSIPEGVRRQQLDSDCNRSSESNSSSQKSMTPRQNNRTIAGENSHNEKPKDQLNLTSKDLQIDNDTGNDEESNESTTSSDQAQISQNTTTFPSLLSNHRKKVIVALISMASLWLYSKYKQKSRRDRRHQLQYGGDTTPDLIQKKVLTIYKLLLQLLSRLRISRFLSLIAKQGQSRSLPGSAAVSNIPMEHATATPLSHLLAVAKAGNISKVMLRGSVVSYLHSMQSSTDSNSSKQHTNQRWSKTTLPSNNPNFLQEILSTLLNHGCDDIMTLPESLWQRFLNGPALVIFPFAYLGALYWIMRRLQKQQLEDSGENDNTFGWNKHGTDRSQQNITTFDDVAGIDSALQELSEVIAYMRSPETFHSVGASPPRGILLHGPPGSGKTLLARAIAGEAGRRAVGATGSLGRGASIDCFAVCSGSDFVETYVGRGAARIRSLFRGVREEAWKNYEQRRRDRRREIVGGRSTDGNVSSTLSHAWGSMQSLLSGTIATGDDGCNEHRRPMAIIFIDEIDALAKRRDSAGLSSSLGGCDEREQTLNQLLTEMDGFASSSSHNQPPSGPSSVIVIVIAATNRIEVLDPAILRAGRFDRHVQVPLPDACGREAILRVHARRIRCDPSSVNFRELAAGKRTNNSEHTIVAPTHQFSGADLKNVINEAALLAVRAGSHTVKQYHLVDAVHKVRCNIRSTHHKEYQPIPPIHQWFAR